jgi:hypothetical protein
MKVRDGREGLEVAHSGVDEAGGTAVDSAESGTSGKSKFASER